MHFLGLWGMPRRVNQYTTNLTTLNVLISYGSLISLFSFALFLFILLLCFIQKNPRQNLYYYYDKKIIISHHTHLSITHHIKY